MSQLDQLLHGINWVEEVDLSQWMKGPVVSIRPLTDTELTKVEAMQHKGMTVDPVSRKGMVADLAIYHRNLQDARNFAVAQALSHSGEITTPEQVAKCPSLWVEIIYTKVMAISTLENVGGSQSDEEEEIGEASPFRDSGKRNAITLSGRNSSE